MCRLALATAFASCILTSVTYGQGTQDESLPTHARGPARIGVSIKVVQALKPLVMNDLREDLSENGERPSQRWVREQFRNCRFRNLPLGKLGRAVLVEFQAPDSGPNSGWYIIYLHRNGGYARIAVGSGFGPYVLSGINGIPDLAFGSTSGICTEYFLRLRYSGTRYKPDACMHNVSDANGDNCHPEACDDSRNLPMFPEPAPSAMQ